MLKGGNIERKKRYFVPQRAIFSKGSKPLFAPANLVAAVTGPEAITATWNNYTGVLTSYTIEHSTTDDFSADVTTITGIDKSLTSYQITGLAPGTHYIRIKAMRGAQASDWSNSVSVNAWVVIETNWNDSSAADGEYTLTVSTPSNSLKWITENETEYLGDILTIPADSGELDGTNKKIALVENLDSLGDVNGFFIANKKITYANLKGFEGCFFSIIGITNSTGLPIVSEIVFAAFTIASGSFQFNRIDLQAATDMELIYFDQDATADHDLNFYGWSVAPTFRPGSKSGRSSIYYSNTQLELRSGSYNEIDLSPFVDFQKSLINAQGNTNLTSFIPPTGTWAAYELNFKSCGITSIDLSDMILLNGGSTISFNASQLASIIFPTNPTTTASVWDLSFTKLVSINPSATVNCKQFIAANIVTLQNFNANNIRVENGTATSFGLKMDFNPLLNYFDISPIYNDWNAGIYINLNSNSFSTDVVNHILVDIDNSIISGSGVILIAGTNSAPDSSSGGYDGDAAVLSLISKGITITTS